MDQLKRELTDRGASLVGFADLAGLYGRCDVTLPSTPDSEKEPFSIPEYPRGVSIAVAIPRDVIRGISSRPTEEYFNAYHEINRKLDALALFCESYLALRGYKAYAQTTRKTKEYGIFRTIMPHKTVAVNGGLGWIGKSALLVTPQYGSAVRLTSVLTDAPLPADLIIPETKCGGCMICAEACPGSAITGRLWRRDQPRDWILDATACRKQARKIAAEALGREITLCGKCIEVCPYTRKYLNS